MSVTAIRPGYHGDMKDSVDKFHGNQLLYVTWAKHLMYATPLCIPVPPQLPFGALVEQVLPRLFGQHPQFQDIAWDRAQWSRDGECFTPDLGASLADNAVGHKTLLCLRTPGLDGLAGAAI